MSANDEHVYYQTRSLCPECMQVIPAKVVRRGEGVFVQRECEQHGPCSGLICADVEWFEDLKRFDVEGLRPQNPNRGEVDKGCPDDCGLCPAHRQMVGTAAVEISNRCNATCPTCLADNQESFELSVQDLRDCLERVLQQQPSVDAFTLSGGEPTIHPDLFEMLDVLRRPEVKRVVVNSNGIRIAQDDDFLQRLSQVEDLFISLHYDGPQAEALRGIPFETQKRALQRLCQAGLNVVPTILATRGVNEEDLGPLTASLLKGAPEIKSIIISMMSYMGPRGRSFPGDPEDRLTIAGALKSMGQTTDGLLSKNAFMPLPMPNPLCAAVGYFLTMDDEITPIIPLAEIDELIEFTKNANFVNPDERFEGLIRGIIDRIYASPERFSNAEKLLSKFKRLLKILFPREALSPEARKAFVEENLKLVYLMQFMDAWSFDTKRLSKCSCVHLFPGDAQIPSCGYYTYHRGFDPRFSLSASPAGS